MSVKNIVLIAYSTTGNTKFVQNQIQKLLSANSSFTITEIDAISIIKAYQLGRRKPENLAVEAVNDGSIPELQEIIRNADVIGVGGFAFGLQPPPGLSEIFAPQYLPSELFGNMKYFFTFGTAGQRIGNLHDVLATILSEKNDKAVYVGGLTVICPENYAPLQPDKGFRDMWGQEQLDKIAPFVQTLIDIFTGNSKANSIPFKKAYFKSTGLMQTMLRMSCGKITVDKTKCRKCGACCRGCPYGALSISGDIEEGFPHWDGAKCQYCHTCFNRCPKEAIDFSAAKTKTKSRHPAPFLDTQTGTIISTDPATHTVKGIPLPTPLQLLKRNAKGCSTLIILVILVLLIIVILLII